MKEFLSSIITLHKKKLYQSALKEINLYEKNNKPNPYIFNFKGLTLWLLDDFKGSIVAYNNGLNLIDREKNNNKPLYVSLINNRGLAYLKLYKNDEALSDFNSALKIDPNFVEALNNIGTTYKNLGKKTAALKFFIYANNKNSNFVPARDNLINSLTFIDSETIDNPICKANLDIKKIDTLIFDKNNKILDSKILSVLSESDKIIQRNLGDISITSTQTFRRGNINLNCERHMKIFKDHNVIPEFCFSCFKILIEPKNVSDLIKLHIFFDNLYLENVRKCMIEMRNNVSGIYKGFIYCKSLEEAQNILSKIHNNLKFYIDKNINVKIKRGCTEYGVKYDEYNNLSKLMQYQADWKSKENFNDEKYPFLKNNLTNKKTSNGVNLKDILTIRNWIYFSYLKKDESFKLVSKNLYDSKYIENRVNN